MPVPVTRAFSVATLDGYGQHVFKGAVAAPYLTKHGLSKDTLDGSSWTTDGSADKVAAAVLDWARDNGASVYTHWFQPICSSGVRHGMAGGLYNHMFEFSKDGTPVWDFKGKNLLRGETDGSSYPNGGLRATNRAGAYIAVDTTSPIFLRDDTIYIPSCLVSYYGHALDEKTPLLRAMDALNAEGTRLLKNLGYKVDSVVANIGLEQEIFLIPREAYLNRPDLQLAGRTILGRMPPRSQEVSDHYMSPPSHASAALACMQEIQEACFKLGIPLRTRHREVAPNQYEFAPLYGYVTGQIDQNLVIMQIIDEIAIKHGLAALLQEKPFQGANGSGKHNNWSLATGEGVNLLNVTQLASKSGSAEIFPVLMAALVKAVDQYGDLMRLSIATPGNDFRLGACEAPPSIISMYLGDDMTNFLEGYRTGSEKQYVATTKLIDMGAKCLAPVEVPAEDRNRTSPFPYGGSRFEFRAVGSSQNVSLVNTVLAAISANAFREFSDAIEKGAKPRDIAKKALNDHWKIIFNGNGYDVANQQKLIDDGLWSINSNIDAFTRFTDPKNVALFESLKVFTRDECEARQAQYISHYVAVVEIEVNCMIDMIQQHILPALRVAGVGPVLELHAAVKTLKDSWEEVHHTEDLILKGHKARAVRVETMQDIRKVTDLAEEVCPAHLWTLATYTELQFLDQTTKLK